MQYHMIKLEIPMQIRIFRRRYRSPFIKGRALITFVCFFFFQRNNIEGAMNNTSFKQTEILSEIELFSFQNFCNV